MFIQKNASLNHKCLRFVQLFHGRSVLVSILQTQRCFNTIQKDNNNSNNNNNDNQTLVTGCIITNIWLYTLADLRVVYLVERLHTHFFCFPREY
jgi:hypothetical protein